MPRGLPKVEDFEASMWRALEEEDQRQQQFRREFVRSINVKGPRYQVLRLQTLDALVEAVASAAVQGWEPVGGVAAVCRSFRMWARDVDAEVWYLQAVMKRENT